MGCPHLSRPCAGIFFRLCCMPGKNPGANSRYGGGSVGYWDAPTPTTTAVVICPRSSVALMER